MATKNPKLKITFTTEELEIIKILDEKNHMSQSALVKKMVDDWREDYEDFLLAVRAKEAEKDESKSLDILKELIRIAVVGAADFTDEEFSEFPIGELTTLSNEIMSFSGLGNAQPEGKFQA